MTSSKVALITGGASGMGLAVAQTLAPKGWTVHLLDFNKAAGVAAAQSLPNSQFHQVDVTSWKSLSGVFAKAFSYQTVRVTYKSNYQYPSQYCPIYSASKAGVIHFMRSIAFPYHHTSGIRVYATCPGTVRTNLMNADEWTTFPEAYFTPISRVASAVEMLVEGGDMTDAWGRTVHEGENYGLAVEINADNVYFRDGTEFCDEAMRVVIGATSMENHLARLEEHKAQQNGGL
ncbi:hypothetical protein QQX98_003339 [Neonectria punicea]|uniref:NAD(P)-binding protein n=1 Tax=Neonectria punicea TaxID=979145 RepID=A0ABR1HEX8_9HYPO